MRIAFAMRKRGREPPLGATPLSRGKPRMSGVGRNAAARR